MDIIISSAKEKTKSITISDKDFISVHFLLDKDKSKEFVLDTNALFALFNECWTIQK